MIYKNKIDKVIRQYKKERSVYLLF